LNQLLKRFWCSHPSGPIETAGGRGIVADGGGVPNWDEDG